MKYKLTSECNLEFRGNIWNLKKKGHFWQCVTQKYIKITPFSEKKGTFLSNITKGSIQLPDADFFWIIP